MRKHYAIIRKKYLGRRAMIVNPYTPGAGMQPSYLAGRDEIIEDAANSLETIKSGYPTRSYMFYGLRGVGKTVLLNAIENKAKLLECEYCHIEVSENDSFKISLSACITKTVHRLSKISAAKDYLKRTIGIFKSFTASWSPGSGDITFGFDEESIKSFGEATSGYFQQDLIDLLVSLGELLSKTETAMAFFIDEWQYLKEEESEAIISAIHRLNQLRLPVIIFGAGLPKLAQMVGDVKSYSERLFQFVEVDSLKKDDAIAALCKPATNFNVIYTEDAIAEIVEITGQYPYFIQEFGSVVWEFKIDNIIDINCVKLAVPEYNEKLDRGFFKVRFDRATSMEKDFMFAMAKCGRTPCTISQVAQNLNRDVSSISPCRSQLIHKGFIYSTQHGEIDFTVPHFSLYLKRINPEL